MWLDFTDSQMGVISPILGLLAMSRDPSGYHNLGVLLGGGELWSERLLHALQCTVSSLQLGIIQSGAPGCLSGLSS